MHSVSWSPNRDYYVDSYSRVDLPNVSELHLASDGALVLELERAEVGDLLATGWKAPEVFVSKARDGSTDIWGIIVRPTNFDPKKKYPVIENIYAGPQGSFVPKTFSRSVRTFAEPASSSADYDGTRTDPRNDVTWKNLGEWRSILYGRGRATTMRPARARDAGAERDGRCCSTGVRWPGCLVHATTTWTRSAERRDGLAARLNTPHPT
jgi:hypothetical protein